MCAHGVLASLTDPGSPPAPSGSVSTTGSILPHGGASGVRGASARWGTPPGLLTAEEASGFVNSCQWFPVSLSFLGCWVGGKAAPHRLEEALGAWLSHTALLVADLTTVSMSIG